MPLIAVIAGIVVLLIFAHGCDKSHRQREETNRRLAEIAKRLQGKV